MPTELNIAPRYAQWAIQGFARLIATWAILQGGLITAGGAKRWSSPAYAVAILVPGAPATWGVSLLVIGALILAGTFTVCLRLTAVALYLLSVWAAGMTTASVAAWSRDERASTGFNYPLLGVIAAVLAVIYWRSGALRASLPERVRRAVVQSPPA